MSTAAILEAFSALHPSQQIQLVEDLWDKVAQSSESLKLEASQKDALRSRKTGHGADLSAGRSWQEVRDSLLSTDGR